MRTLVLKKLISQNFSPIAMQTLLLIVTSLLVAQVEYWNIKLSDFFLAYFHLRELKQNGINRQSGISPSKEKAIILRVLANWEWA